MTKKPNKNWEERFNKEFPELGQLYAYPALLREFIAIEKKASKLEGIEMCIGEEKKSSEDITTIAGRNVSDMDFGFNLKREEIKELKEKLKQEI